MARVLTLFEQLCDLDDESVEAALSEESQEVRARVLGMIAADRTGAAIDEDEVAWALAGDLIDDLSDLPPDWSAPRAVEGVELVRELGRGGMGVVYEGLQRNPERRVAVKFLGPAYANAAEEAKSLAALRHPAIPIIFQVGVADGAVYLIMEHVAGVGVLEWSEHHSTAERLQMFLALCDAVQHAHDAGLLHRDLKPGNVLVDGQRPWVLDFGLAQVEGVGAKGVVGTLPYIAGEVLQGAPATRRSDVFSLGVLLAEILGGPRPTRGSRGSLARQRRSRAARPPDRWAEHPIDEINSIVQRALAPPGERYATVRDLGADIERYMAGLPTVAHGGGTLYRLRLLARRRPMAVLTGAATAVFLASAVTMTVQRRVAVAGREARAEVQLERVRRVVDEAVAADDLDRAEEVLDRALLDPSLRRTRAAAGLLQHVGRALDAGGRAGPASRRLAQAHLETADPEQQVDVLLDLQSMLIWQRKWQGLARLAELLPAEHRREAERVASIALRRSADGARWSFLDQAVRSPIRSTAVKVVGDEVQAYEVSSNTLHLSSRTLEPRAFVEGPSTHLLTGEAVEDGVFWLGRIAGGTGVWFVGEDGVLEHVTDLVGPGSGLGAPLGTTVARMPGGREVLLVATTSPARELFAIDVDTWESFHPDELTDALSSDVLDMSVLPGPDSDDVVLFSSPWLAYDVRIHSWTGDRLGLAHRGRVGGVVRGAVVQHDDEGWLVMRKDDAVANEHLFSDARPFGVASGVYVVRPSDDGLEVVDELLQPTRGWVGTRPVVGDFDGDGQDDVVFGAGGDTVQWVFLGPDGIADTAWTEGIVPLAAADVDGDGDDELYVRVVDDDHHLWILGTGDGSLPPIMAEAVAWEGEGTAGLLHRLGLLDAATSELEQAAATTDDPQEAVRLWNLAADHSRGDGQLARAQRALVRSLALQPDQERTRELLRSVLRQRQVFDARGVGPVEAGLPATPAVRLDFRGDGVDAFEIEGPAALTAGTDGLDVSATGGDGVLMSVPVVPIGPHHALEAVIDLEVVELGALLELALLDERGRTVHSVGFAPYGGGRAVDRVVSCGGVLGNYSSVGGLRDQTTDVDRFVMRISHLDGESLCQVDRNGEMEESGWTPDHGEAGPPVRLVLRMRSRDGYESSMIGATLREITVEGMRLEPVEPSPLLPWIRGDLSQLPDAIRGTGLEPLWHVRRQDIAAVERTRHLLAEASWIPTLRRHPMVWLLALDDAPQLLGRRYAAAWLRPLRSAVLEQVVPTLEHPLVDRFPVEAEGVAALLRGRSELLLSIGRPDRALAVLRRLPEEEVDALEKARVLMAVGDVPGASSACRAALRSQRESTVMLDLIANDPRLQRACGVRGNDALIDGSRP